MNVTRGRDSHTPSDRPIHPAWFSTIVALVLLAHLAGVHRDATHTSNRPTAAATAALARGAPAMAGVVAIVGDMQDAMTRCPAAQLLTPRPDAPAHLAPIGFVLLGMLAGVAAVVGGGPRDARQPRPPGPTRQALLQRFTL